MRRCPDPDSVRNLVACDAELRIRDLQESSGRQRGPSCLSKKYAGSLDGVLGTWEILRVVCHTSSKYKIQIRQLHMFALVKRAPRLVVNAPDDGRVANCQLACLLPWLFLDLPQWR